VTTPFDISARYVDELVALSPTFATALGVPGRDARWDDLSPDGEAAKAALAEHAVADLAPHFGHPDPNQRLAAQVVSEYAAHTVDAHQNLDHLRALAHTGSPFQVFREIFEFVDHTDPEAATDAARRLETIGAPLGGYQQTLAEGLELGEIVARRQVESVLAQIERLIGPRSAWHLLEQDSPIPVEMSQAINVAKREIAEFGAFLSERYLPNAPAEDGVGREPYRRAARAFLGIEIDPDELYEWGWQEIDRLLGEMRSVAASIDPSLDLQGVILRLETDQSLAVESPDELVRFVAARQRQAIDELDASHFDLAEEYRDVTVAIAPPGGALGAYYRQPSEDFTRPGGIYYSIGDQRTFPLYQEVSTAYHEGFPGHHLQIATAMAARERLSRAQRVLIWYPGYGEGWALYVERLMHELGYFERPEWVFGMLASHLFRAARVVTDIGLHLGYPIPAGSPLFAGEPWDFDRAVRFMTEIGPQPPDYAESEVIRYLGWPGQAISYKIGEREILRLRESERMRLGERFDLKDFHARVLGSGEMGLELLGRVVAGEFDS
jgi:uncharacterized protein (DUF885 family)